MKVEPKMDRMQGIGSMIRRISISSGTVSQSMVHLPPAIGASEVLVK